MDKAFRCRSNGGPFLLELSEFAQRERAQRDGTPGRNRYNQYLTSILGFIMEAVCITRMVPVVMPGGCAP